MAAMYKIAIETSNAYMDSGTDSTVYIQMVSEDGQKKTHWQVLDLPWHNDFEPGSTDVYNVKFLDIGFPAIIRIKLKAILGIKDEWLCSKIDVTYGGQTITFPVYDYIEKEAEYASGEAKIPQKEVIEEVMELRKREIAKNKSQFVWTPREATTTGFRGFPRYFHADEYENLPAIFRRVSPTLKDEHIDQLKVAISDFVKKIKSVGVEVKNFDDFKSIAEVFAEDGNSRYLHNWSSDEGQGWQILNITHPLYIKVCKEIPTYFNITNDDLKDLLNGHTLTEELQNGNLYMIDLTEIYGKSTSGTPMSIPDACPPVVALLYQDNDREEVRLVAVQLKPDSRGYLFTSDGSDDWMLAKMYLRCSLNNIQQWISRTLHTHLIMEPFACSTFRCLSRNHPVYKLLKPHLASLPAVNTITRSVILTPDAKVSQGYAMVSKSFIRQMFESFTIDDLNIPKVLEKQGLRPDQMPNYLYGKDSLRVWKIIENYVRSILLLYYKNDQEVIDDYEIQDWATDIVSEGIAWEDGNPRGISGNYETIEQLIEICTVIIATCTAQYSATNFDQFELLRFAPNSPCNMRKPVHKKGEADMERIIASLPSGIQAAKVVGFAFALSQYNSVEDYIGSFQEFWFTDESALKCQENFRSDLAEMNVEIQARNERAVGKQTYNYLKPSCIPKNIVN